MKWLVTAFAPFGGAKTNSSLIVLNHLSSLDWQGRVEFHSPVPVEFSLAWDDVRRALNQREDIKGVLALGQAETRARIGLECVALNWIDARIPDNGGHLPVPAPIQEGPDVYWSKIPWQDFALSERCERSYSAGTFVCNTLMYQSLDWAQKDGNLAGFVHIPALESQGDESFAKSPRMTDKSAFEETCRILEYCLSL